jgi:hypothetical protein
MVFCSFLSLVSFGNTVEEGEQHVIIAPFVFCNFILLFQKKFIYFCDFLFCFLCFGVLFEENRREKSLFSALFYLSKKGKQGKTGESKPNISNTI